MGGGLAKGRRGSAAFPIPDYLLHRGTPRLRAVTGNHGSFQRHGDWDSFGVARRHAMKLPRRQFLHLAAATAALPAISRFAWAQTPDFGRAQPGCSATLRRRDDRDQALS